MTKQEKSIILSEIIIDQAVALAKCYYAEDFVTHFINHIKVEVLEVQKRTIIAQPIT